MHLRLSDPELATLVEMVCLATQAATWNRLPEHHSDFERFVHMEQKILSRALEAGIGDWIEFDPDEKRLSLAEEFRETLYAQKCVDEMRSEIFWEELMFRLAERDLIKEMGASQWDNLSDEQRADLTKPLEERYFSQFRNKGLDGLHLIHPRNEG